jgi:hypothetical protein
MLQDVGIFGNQRGLGQIDPRHHCAAVTRVGIIRKVQTECGIEQAVFTLRVFGELKLAPAVDAVARLLEMESQRATRPLVCFGPLLGLGLLSRIGAR